MSKDQKDKFYDKLNTTYKILYEIHNLLTVGDITLEDAVTIYQKVTKFTTELQELSDMMENEKFASIELKKRAPEIGGIFLCEFLSSLVLGPLGIIVIIFCYKRIKEIINEMSDESQKIPLSVKKIADTAIMKIELFQDKLIKPLDFLFDEFDLDRSEDREAFKNSVLNACQSIYNYVINGEYTFEHTITERIATVMLQQNIGTDLNDLILLLEMFKAKYNAKNMMLKRTNPK